MILESIMASVPIDSSMESYVTHVIWITVITLIAVMKWIESVPPAVMEFTDT